MVAHPRSARRSSAVRWAPKVARIVPESSKRALARPPRAGSPLRNLGAVAEPPASSAPSLEERGPPFLPCGTWSVGARRPLSERRHAKVPHAPHQQLRQPWLPATCTAGPRLAFACASPHMSALTAWTVDSCSAVRHTVTFHLRHLSPTPSSRTRSTIIIQYEDTPPHVPVLAA